jgi:transposase
LTPDLRGFVLAARIDPVPKAFPAEFRADVIAVARKGEAPLRQIAKDFGISEACLHRWLKIADRDDGVDSGGSRAGRDQSAELREAHKRIKLLEQEAEVMRRAVGYLSRGVNPK